MSEGSRRLHAAAVHSFARCDSRIYLEGQANRNLVYCFTALPCQAYDAADKLDAAPIRKGNALLMAQHDEVWSV